MGFQAILTSFLQSCFFLIKVFQEFKAGGQINKLYILVYQHLSRPLLRRALKYPFTARWWRSGANCKKGGGNVRDIIAVTLGSPQGSPQTPLRWLLVMYQRHIPIVYSLHNSRGLTSLRIYLSYQFILFHIHALQPPAYKSPHTFFHLFAPTCLLPKKATQNNQVDIFRLIKYLISKSCLFTLSI